MEITLWGTRGSLPTPGLDMLRYGGNTSCVSVRGKDGTVLVLDAGTGIRRLGSALAHSVSRVDILLTHLHMDHIQGLGFFGLLYEPGLEVHFWGPASTTLDLRGRLSRYLSPPLFPVLLRDLPCKLQFHEVPCPEFQIGGFKVLAELVCHPGPTVGYRIQEGSSTMAYIPDHEPALGVAKFPLSGEWTSGYDLAAGVDLLIHDAQYTALEYPSHLGWGHSSLPQTLAFAELAGVKHLVPFHHDPARDDDFLALTVKQALNDHRPAFKVTPAAEGARFTLPAA